MPKPRGAPPPKPKVKAALATFAHTKVADMVHDPAAWKALNAACDVMRDVRADRRGLAPVELNLSHKPLRLPPIDGDAPREVKEPPTKGLEKRKRAVPKAFEMPAPPELLS